jgi:predicted NBD/HSP70 family sugar kinase/mannose-6-phosphate isomerase class I
MTKQNKKLSIDVGGSHIALSVIDCHSFQNNVEQINRYEINSYAQASEIVGFIAQKIVEQFLLEPDIDGIGFAFPGPFHYQTGTSIIKDVGGKFEKTFGLDIKQAIKDFTGLYHQKICFANDAHCFALGAFRLYQLKSKRTLFLTLGTGIGSAYIHNGSLLINHNEVPPDGYLYNQPFLSGKAEDFFSARWIESEYQKLTGKSGKSVKDLAEEKSPESATVFKTYGTNLGRFLVSWLTKYQCDELVIGGSIARANSCFKSALEEELQHVNPLHTIRFCQNTEECILAGAALLHEMSDKDSISPDRESVFRKTTQPELPLTPDTNASKAYNPFPAFQSDQMIFEGFDLLASLLLQKKTVIIDGYGGILWSRFKEQMQKAMQGSNKKILWYDISTCFKNPEELNQMIATSINGNDPVFGKKFTGSLPDFFDSEKLALIKQDTAADLCIVYGTGASLCNWDGWLLYLDVPKNEIQYRMRAGSIANLGFSVALSNTQAYKQFYFVDWPVLNKHKEDLLPKINCIADEQRTESITWMQGDAFRSVLNNMLTHAIRARPWFEAGIWGGNWMKEHLSGLNNAETNYAWSFELITPENGIIIEGNGLLLEVSFDYLLYMNHQMLLGMASKRFGKEFPIRFDFLDTFDGGNLSVQCHPRPEYIKNHFGENFTQDETYYILDCKPDAKVYLGFQETINPDKFKSELIAAQAEGKELDVEYFVQKHDAHKHDLFLIPNGTIHASGKNNMVLEISNTPYIFTFKMYDWLRVDSNGQSRPINIEHAYKNLYFDRKGDYVANHLISHPFIAAKWENGRKINLPTHQEHFYAIDRYEFTGEIEIHTKGHCHCCMLVEGSHIEVITGNRTNKFFFAETFIIPASVEKYQVRNNDHTEAFLIVAFVKNEAC